VGKLLTSYEPVKPYWITAFGDTPSPLHFGFQAAYARWFARGSLKTMRCIRLYPPNMAQCAVFSGGYC